MKFLFNEVKIVIFLYFELILLGYCFLLLL